MKHEKICKSCGCVFTTKAHNTKYCRDCRNSFNVVIKKCQKCGVEFETTNRNRNKCVNCRYDYSQDITKTSPFMIFKRDDFTCVYCGKSSIIDKVKLVIDHIIPVKHGGSGELNNLITSCQDCNSRKSDKRLRPSIEQSLIERCEKLNKTLNIKDRKEIEKIYNQITNSRYLLIRKPIRNIE